MQSFLEALLAEKAFTMDVDGIFTYQFGPENEYQLCIEPLLYGQFYLALYRDGWLMWPEKIPIKPGYTIPEGPGEEEVERRKWIREQLTALLAMCDEADRKAGKP